MPKPKPNPRFHPKIGTVTNRVPPLLVSHSPLISRAVRGCFLALDFHISYISHFSFFSSSVFMCFFLFVSVGLLLKSWSGSAHIFEWPPLRSTRILYCRRATTKKTPMSDCMPATLVPHSCCQTRNPLLFWLKHILAYIYNA